MKQAILSALFLILATLSFAQDKETLTVNFEFNKYDLTTETVAKLDAFFDTVSRHEIAFIQLSGYCDSRGSNRYNGALSLKRVNSIKLYLENKKNIKTDSLIAQGFGKTGLLNGDATEEEHHLNRRVEIIVQLKDKPVIKEQPVTEVKKETKTLTAILEDTAVKKGAVISIPNLEFYNNSNVLLPQSTPTLQELFNILVKNPKMKISIEGHICCVPYVAGVPVAEQQNFQVSVIRAKMVYDYLVKNGIDPDRLAYDAFGNSRPIYPIPEKTEEEIIANRRVEIRIINK